MIYQGNGYGNLWIVNERMYLYRNNSKENKERELFSLNMQGKDEHAYGDYEVHAVYDKYLVLTNSEETEIYVMNTEAGKIQLIRRHGQLLEEEYVAEGISVKAYVTKEIYGKI